MTITLERLLICSTVMSLVAMLLAAAALWPHSQDGLRKVRDGVLWFAFIFVLVGVLTVVCRQLERYATQPSSATSEPVAAVYMPPSFAPNAATSAGWRTPADNAYDPPASSWARLPRVDDRSSAGE